MAEDDTRTKRLKYYDSKRTPPPPVTEDNIIKLMHSLEKHLHIRDVREKRALFLDKLERKTKKRKRGAMPLSPSSTSTKRKTRDALLGK